MSRDIRYLASLLMLICAFGVPASCTHKAQIHQPTAIPLEPDSITFKDVVYGYDDTEQNMNVSLPAGRNGQNTPVIIMIHGGAWAVGKKEDNNGLELETYFMSKGCAVINMNYRLRLQYPDVAPKQVADIDTVIAYIERKSAVWKINPERICLLGGSVGGHLALTYGYTRNTQQKVKAVIDGFGPTDFLDGSIGPLYGGVEALLGTFSTDSQRWHDWSPVFFGISAVPTVILHGSDDSLVLPAQSQILKDSLDAHRVANMYVIWNGKKHEWPLNEWRAGRDSVWTFIHRWL